MGCGDQRPCGFEDRGPFVVSSKGRFRTLAGAPMAPPHEAQRRRRARVWAGRGVGRGGREPLGARLGSAWTSESGVGLPRPNDEGFTPLGTHLAEDASLRAEGTALGSGGRGSGEYDRAGAVVVPIGSRPSVSARIGVDFERIGKLPGSAPDPFGLQPLELTEEQVYGSGAAPFDNADSAWTGADGALQLVQPSAQYVPPPPASQGFCLINGFDPRWGQPPKTWRGVVMRFDPGMGAYRFDPHSARVREAFDRAESPRLLKWFEDVSTRYRSGYMLQPYMPHDGSGQWAFRWIPRRQEVVCV